MKLTNKLNLPQPIYDAVKNDPYSRGDSDESVTGILSPPRVRTLMKQHKDEISEDASDRIFSLCGQVMHGILERSNTTGIAERRLGIMVEGWRISGGMDAYYAEGLLQDYKFVTSWKFKTPGVPIEYEQQLNVYAEILRANGHPVTKLQIVGILRDWSKLEAARDPLYPQTQVVVRNVALWPSEKAYKFLVERVRLHKEAREKLPLCTAEERWAKPDVYAVMKRGRKTAVKLYDDEKLALAHAKTDDALSVVFRRGDSTRCAHYCAVAPFCTQRQEMTKDSAAVADESTEATNGGVRAFVINQEKANGSLEVSGSV